MKSKILFILKRREDYNHIIHSPNGLSTGLFNSASFMNNMLRDLGYESNIEVAIDNNCIDKLVTKYKPTHVIIEALWVVPSKFFILSKLHPTVKWIVRLHSEMPFMAGEGMAMKWVGDYADIPQIILGVNAPRMLSEVREYLRTAKAWNHNTTLRRVVYLPNHYPITNTYKRFDDNKNYVDIGCFGAIRPLKNHLLQAHAAMQFANYIGKKLRFHINAGRIEMQGSSALHNLQGMFSHLVGTGHRLISHDWAQHEDFLKLCASMDIGLQCNFSETFNIVCADLISQGVPIVGSKEIPWSSSWFNADPTSSEDICNSLVNTYKFPQINVWRHRSNLKAYVRDTATIWNDYFISH